LDALPEFGGEMRLRQPPEAMPLSVWITLVLLAIGTIIYLTAVFLIDDITALFSEKK